MLKPYRDRVRATYELMESAIAFTAENRVEIKRIRAENRQQSLQQQKFELAWNLDTTSKTSLAFHGYEAGTRKSEVSGLPVLYYDRNKPFVRQIPFYNWYRSTLEIKRPEAYIIPQGWWKVIERLKQNKVRMSPLRSDTTIKVTVYKIVSYKPAFQQYEGHHPNTELKIEKQVSDLKFRKGDLYIPLNQAANRFIMQVLEPEAADSYFYWNFFDPVLGAKEHYSAYAFEESAAAYLRKNPELQKRLDERRAADSSFARSARAQLDFVFRNSPYYEPDHLRYPVYRIEGQTRRP